jgi:hypothetical protein
VETQTNILFDLLTPLCPQIVSFFLSWMPGRLRSRAIWIRTPSSRRWRDKLTFFSTFFLLHFSRFFLLPFQDARQGAIACNVDMNAIEQAGAKPPKLCSTFFLLHFSKRFLLPFQDARQAAIARNMDTNAIEQAVERQFNILCIRPSSSFVSSKTLKP